LVPSTFLEDLSEGGNTHVRESTTSASITKKSETY